VVYCQCTATTETELLRLDGEGVHGELIPGVLCETMAAGIEHGEIVVNLAIALGAFVKPKRLGRLVASGAGVWLKRDPDTVREPDVEALERLAPSCRRSGGALGEWPAIRGRSTPPPT